MQTIITAFAFGIVSFAAHATEISFESSDGLWSDSTVERKGRDFQSILWYFEAYRLKQNKPEVTLVRITPKPMFANRDPKWEVPLAESSGNARRYADVYSPDEKAEIKRRAESAYKSWKARSEQSRTSQKRANLIPSRVD